MSSKAKIHRFLRLTNDRGASDLHLSVGRPPMLRVSGEMEQVRYSVLRGSDFVELLKPITPPAHWQAFESTGDADFSFEVPGVSRCRVNLFRQARGAGAVFRLIPSTIMTLEQLGLPQSIERIVGIQRGLVLVTGPTGSGKSTTLAAVIDEINRRRSLHIITIEDPIEFVHQNKRSLIHHREVGVHATSFAEALRAAGREDPDLILVGELRDLPTISMALAAAERGTVVFATLHTNNAAKTVDRIINVFPANEQDRVRGVLGDSLRAVVAQQLLPKVNGGRVAAVEILFGSPALSGMIREGKTHQITSFIQTGSREGMIDMDAALQGLLQEGLVTPRAAYEKAVNKESFAKLVEVADVA
jgi:twitching motility protein PilT